MDGFSRQSDSKNVDKRLGKFQTARARITVHLLAALLFLSAAVAQAPADVRISKMTPVESTIELMEGSGRQREYGKWPSGKPFLLKSTIDESAEKIL